MIVTFSGLDGAGKTTQARMLDNWLRSQGVASRVIEAHRLSVYGILGSVARNFAQGLTENLVSHQYDLSSSSRKRTALGLFRMFTFPIDLAMFRLWVGVIQRKRATVVICDRSPLDELVQLTYLGFYHEARFVACLRQIPRVDIAVLLSASPREAHNRNPEYPLEHFVRKAKLYSEATRVMPLNVVKGTTVEDVFQQVKALVGEYLSLSVEE